MWFSWSRKLGVLITPWLFSLCPTFPCSCFCFMVQWHPRGFPSWDWTWRLPHSESSCLPNVYSMHRWTSPAGIPATCYQQCVSNEKGVPCFLFMEKSEPWFSYVRASRRPQNPVFLWNSWPKFRAKNYPPLGMTNATSYKRLKGLLIWLKTAF